MRSTLKICSIDGCGQKIFCRGWCSAHYRRWQRHRDPLGGGPKVGVALDWVRAHVGWSDDQCLIWPFRKHVDGRSCYIYFEGRAVLAARVMCILAHGAPPRRKPLAAHSCGMGHKACVNPKHMYWASSAENQFDRWEHGTGKRGEENPLSRFSESEIRLIRKLHAESGEWGRSARLARQFDTTSQHISSIVHRKIWAWLE